MKGLQIMKKVRSYEKGTKKVLSYKKGTKLRTWYKVTKKVRWYEKVRSHEKDTNKVRSYEKGTKLRTWYEATKKVRSDGKGTKMLRSKLRKALVMKLPSYEIVTPPIGIIYYNA